jgi:hypothetical protein
MTDKELNIKLREMAREAGLCDEWYEKWGDDDTTDDNLERYIKGFDFGLKNDWPSLDFIRENFHKEDLHRHHIYLDEEVELNEGENGYYVFLGSCSGSLLVSGFYAITVYCRHDSNLEVKAFDGARVSLFYYDHSRGSCKSDNYSRVKVFDRKKRAL